MSKTNCQEYDQRMRNMQEEIIYQENKAREFYEIRFIEEFNHIATLAHDNAVNHGFWEGGLSDGECIALMHSELSEALEALRNGNPPDKHVPEFSNLEVELADCMIIIMGFAKKKRLNVVEALIEKMRFNETRPYKHGKEF